MKHVTTCPLAEARNRKAVHLLKILRSSYAELIQDRALDRGLTVLRQAHANRYRGEDFDVHVVEAEMEGEEVLEILDGMNHYALVFADWCDNLLDGLDDLGFYAKLVRSNHRNHAVYARQ
jgi:hypothetical protein